MSKLIEAYEVIVEHLRSLDVTNSQYTSNFHGTAARCAKALLENNLSASEIRKQLDEIIGRTFNVQETGENDAGMVTQGPITVNSMCPHHLMPVRYEAWLSYIPQKNRVLGLSKLARIAKLLGSRPVLQEQLAIDIADTLHTQDVTKGGLKSYGSAVTLVGTHTCMACRGVESDARTTVTELRGTYWEPGVESKYLAAVQLTRNAKTF